MRTFVLIIGMGILLSGAGAGLAFGGPPSQEAWLALGVLAVLILLITIAGAICIARGFGEPPGDLQDPKALQLWSRSQAALYLQPAIMTILTAPSLSMASAWLEGERRLALPLVLFAYMLMGFVLVTQGLLGYRGKPDTPERRRFERMNDEVTLGHARDAYQVGFFGLMLGLGLIAAAALLAPRLVLYALVAAFWMGIVPTSVRFGLLQRARLRAAAG